MEIAGGTGVGQWFEDVRSRNLRKLSFLVVFLQQTKKKTFLIRRTKNSKHFYFAE